MELRAVMHLGLLVEVEAAADVVPAEAVERHEVVSCASLANRNGICLDRDETAVESLSVSESEIVNMAICLLCLQIEEEVTSIGSCSGCAMK